MPDTLSITDALEQLALTLGRSDAVAVPELIRALERAAERLRTGTVTTQTPHDLISQSEASRLVGVSRQAVSQWVRRGVVRSYLAPNNNGRHTPMVSLAEVVTVANRSAEPPFSSTLRAQYLRFLEEIRDELGHGVCDLLAHAVEPENSAKRSAEASHVLREFVTAAMGTSSMQQEFTEAGVQMLADLRPLIVVDQRSGFGRLAGSLGLLIHSATGASGFDSATAAVLGLLGCATIGAAMDGGTSETARKIAGAAQDIWGSHWVGRLFDLAFQLEELSPSPLTRYTASLTYLGTNRFLRQAQAAGVSITYARSPGAILPESYYGDALFADRLAERRVDPDWRFSTETRPLAAAAMHRSEGNPFRFFSFEHGVLDASIHGVRRYCFSTEDARRALRLSLEGLTASQRNAYIEQSVERMAKTVINPFIELSAIDRLEDFDWWKDHIIRSSPREILLGLRSERARTVAHALMVQTSILPEVIESADTDGSLRDRLRIYVKNLEFGIVDERYSDDVHREVTRVIKPATETIHPSEAYARAEAEITALLP